MAISILIFSTLEIHLYSTSIHMLNYCLCKLTKFSRVFFSKLTSPCLLVSLYLIFMWIWRTWGINVDFFFKWTFSCNGSTLMLWETTSSETGGIVSAGEKGIRDIYGCQDTQIHLNLSSFIFIAILKVPLFSCQCPNWY